MKTADLHRELRKAGLDDTEVFRASALKRITFQFVDDYYLKVTYHANDPYATAAAIVRYVLANMDKAVQLDPRTLWIPLEATVHFMGAAGQQNDK